LLRWSSGLLILGIAACAAAPEGSYEDTELFVIPAGAPEIVRQFSEVCSIAFESLEQAREGAEDLGYRVTKEPEAEVLYSVSYMAERREGDGRRQTFGWSTTKAPHITSTRCSLHVYADGYLQIDGLDVLDQLPGFSGTVLNLPVDAGGHHTRLRGYWSRKLDDQDVITLSLEQPTTSFLMLLATKTQIE